MIDNNKIKIKVLKAKKQTLLDFEKVLINTQKMVEASKGDFQEIQESLKFLENSILDTQKNLSEIQLKLNLLQKEEKKD